MTHHLHGAALAITWVALAAGVVALLLGVRAVVVGRRSDSGRRPSTGWTQALLGTFVLIETIPRVSGASDGLTMTLSLVAFVPLVLSVLLPRHAAAR